MPKPKPKPSKAQGKMDKDEIVTKGVRVCVPCVCPVDASNSHYKIISTNCAHYSKPQENKQVCLRVARPLKDVRAAVLRRCCSSERLIGDKCLPVPWQ